MSYMHQEALRIAGVLSAVVLLLAGCGRKQPEPVNPHSVEAILGALAQHVTLLDEAAQRDDFRYVHDYSYYVKNLAQALYFEMDDQQKARTKDHISELVKVAGRLDFTSGRRQRDPTLAGTQRLQEIIQELDAQLTSGRRASRSGAAGGFEKRISQHILQSKV